MKKTLRKKFILFAMLAVTILLVVLIGAISGLSWVALDGQSSAVLHALANGGGDVSREALPAPKPFLPPMNMDTLQSARFFVVHVDGDGKVLDADVEQISSISAEEAAQYAALITDAAGKTGPYKYEVKQLGAERLIFFLDTSSQWGTFAMVLSISSAIALVCWLAIFLFVILLSGRVVRPILAGMEKQKQFITNAGHELKTPLSIIQSNNDAATLIHGETKYSKNIRMQTQRLNLLMTNLLTLAKLDEETKLPTETVNISELTGGMLATYEDSLAQKQIALSTKVREGVFLQVHRDTFSQMISILLDNAAKYTPAGGAVTLRAVGYELFCRVDVTDTGPGIPESEQARIFQRFYRSPSASEAEGVGIGLYLARQIAAGQGGYLKVSSRPGEGSTFSLFLPRAEERT